MASFIVFLLCQPNGTPSTFIALLSAFWGLKHVPLLCPFFLEQAMLARDSSALQRNVRIMSERWSKVLQIRARAVSLVQGKKREDLIFRLSQVRVPSVILFFSPFRA